ncbi:hypothetical protein BH20CHL3_BH20CHL3_01730 [soil metagenome]
MTTAALDSRSWLAWGLAAMTPLLLGRNPWVLLEVLIVVVAVRLVWLPRANHQGMGWFLRIAAAFMAIGVLFNVLTVHAGDRVFGSLHEAWPIIGGELTWNALVYGVLSGVALFTLVLIGITVSSHISWIELVHVLPPRLATIAVTGSVAWAFLPQTAVAWRHIREAQTMRGHTFRGIRDFIPIVVPLLAGGLERSFAVSEALESRGFGASGAPRSTDHPIRSAFADLGLIVGLVGLAAGAYCVAVGMLKWAVASFGVGFLALFATSRLAPSPGIAITRYRTATWRVADTLVTASAAVAFGIVAGWSLFSPDALAFWVYPELLAPRVDIIAILAIGLLLVPALVVGEERG